MSVSLFEAQIAREFWNKTREPETFPRNLRRAIPKAVPLTVEFMPRFSIRVAVRWLRQHGITCKLPGVDRQLKACLVARNGFALVDGSDDEDEQRFSIAHELAHFLRDYWLPRQRVLKRLGADALKVLDGRRPPTDPERFHSLLRNVPLGLHLHLLERDEAGSPLKSSTAQAEEKADRLAYELLAPAEHILLHGTPGSPEALAETLRRDHGLPAAQALHYAGILLPPAKTDPLLRRLKLLT